MIGKGNTPRIKPDQREAILLSILSAYFKENTINGQDATVIYFDRESPLLTIALDRKQLHQFSL